MMSDANENENNAGAAMEEQEIMEETNPTPVLNIVSHPGNIKLDKFDGRSSWRLYHRQFQRVSKMNGWENLLSDYLWIHLTGDALAYIEELPDAATMSYDEMNAALDQRFGAERLADVHKAQLLNMKRENGQSLAELGQQVRKLVNNAYPKFNFEAKEEIAIEKFLDTLETETRRSIYQENPRSLSQAIEKGLKIEAWGMREQSMHGKTNVRVAVDAEDEDESEHVRILRDLQNKVNDLHIKKKDYSKDRQITCFYCGKPGHIAAECYSKKRDEGTRLPQKGSRLTCYRCGGRGHRSTECATPEN